MVDDIRVLPFPLKNPTVIGGIVGSGENESPFDVLQWVTSDPDERVTVELQLSLNEYVALASSIDVGRDIAYGTESQYVWWLWTRAFIRTLAGVPVTPIEPTSDIDFRLSPVAVFVINENEELDVLKIEVIDGKPFLEEDCGCGVRHYYTLTQSSINPQTGALSDVIDTVPSYISNVPLTQTQIDECYAARVAEIITSSLVAYVPAIFNYGTLGVAAFAPATGAALLGAIEIQQSVVSALQGNLTLDLSEVGYTPSEVIAVFNSNDFQAFLSDRLGDDQQIARWVLQAVALRLLNRSDLNFPTPTYPIFQAWVYMVDMSRLNQELELAAAECNSGTFVPGTGVPSGATWYWEFDFLTSTDTWNPIDGNHSVWVDGVGFTPGVNATNDHYITISKAGLTNILGVDAFFDSTLNGSNNTCFLNTTDPPNTDPELAVDGTGLTDVIMRGADFAATPALYFMCIGNNFDPGGDTMDQNLIGLTVYGDGGVPSGATPI